MSEPQTSIPKTTKSTRKKILFTAANLLPPVGGAERSAVALAERLGRDFEVTLITPHNENLIKKMNGYTLIAKKKPFYLNFFKSFFKIAAQNIWWAGVLRNFLRENKYDFVATHGILIPSLKSIETARKIIFIRGLSAFTPNVSDDPIKAKDNLFKYLPLIFKLQYPLVRSFRDQCVKTIKNADIVVANVDFLRKVTKYYTGRDSWLVYSEVKADEFRTKMKKRENILCITPSYSKGLDIVIEIAKRMPKKNFVVIGKPDPTCRKYYKEIESMRNIKFLGHQTNMKKMYENTWLLLAPSRVYEGFGRVTADAMVNGIPSVASNRGGLPEIVGNSGEIVENYDDVDEWVRKIRKFNSEKHYNRMSGLSRKRIAELTKTVEEQYRNFIKFLKSQSGAGTVKND